MPKASRLLTSTLTFGQDLSRASTRRAEASRTCSQLSSVSSACLSLSAVRRDFVIGSPALLLLPPPRPRSEAPGKDRTEAPTPPARHHPEKPPEPPLQPAMRAVSCHSLRFPSRSIIVSWRAGS